MFKVVILALVLAGLLFVSRSLRPRKGAAAWAGLRGALWGGLVSACLALIFTALTPSLQNKPYHLSIYLIGWNMLLTPAFLVLALIRALQSQPVPEKTQEKPSFQGILEKIPQGSQAE